MNWIDFAAIIGAAAWSYPLGQLIYYKFILRPVVNIFPDKQVEIGFTTFGPIFNLRIAFYVKNKNAVVDFVQVRLKHESDSKEIFQWTGMTEIFSELKATSGITQSVQRDTVPLAILLNITTITERWMRFQSESFMRNTQDITKLIDHIQFLKKQGKKVGDEILNSKEFHDYKSFIKKQFIWRAGNYDVEFLIRSPENAILIPKKFKFTLSQAEVDNLMENLNRFDECVANIGKKIDDENFQFPEIQFNWKYAKLN